MKIEEVTNSVGLVGGKLTRRCVLCHSTELNEMNYCERCEIVVPVEEIPKTNPHETDTIAEGDG